MRRSGFGRLGIGRRPRPEPQNDQPTARQGRNAAAGWLAYGLFAAAVVGGVAAILWWGTRADDDAATDLVASPESLDIAYSHSHAHRHADGVTHSHPHAHVYSIPSPDTASAPGSVPAAAPARTNADAATGADAVTGAGTAEGGAAPVAAGGPSSRVWTVVYGDDGAFAPERVEITTGDTVRFVNESAVPVWPASNIHPTHEILPEFDPLEAIPPGESWSFTFTENGWWRYHNHIDASQTGTVVATGATDTGAGVAPLLADMTVPEFPPFPAEVDGEALFDDTVMLAEFVERFGPAGTAAALKEAEQRTGRYCHDTAHDVGRLAYEIFGPIAFSIAGHDCQSGALHGATEAMFADRGTARLAEDTNALCGLAENKFVRHQCFHGVGHGLMAWTSYEIHEALGLCDQVHEDDAPSCYSGVFMENVVGGLSGLMGHTTEYLLDDDPHYPCDVVGERYRADCYYYQTTHMWRVFDGDMSAVAATCATLDGAARELCFSSYGRDVGNLTRGDPAAAVELCGHAPAGADRVECLSGAAQDRFWETSGSDEAIVMCSLLSDADEAGACWWTIIDRAGDVYTEPSGRRGFCDRVPESWRARCESQIAA